jgi:Uma2 family endonuclease
MEGIAITPQTAVAYLTLPTEPARQPPMPRLFPISVEKYHAMIDAGILTENDRCELIEGLLVEKMGKNPPHSYVTGWIAHWLYERESSGWFAQSQEPITTLESEPEPDLSVILGRREDYAKRHPRPDEVLLIIEVAESTLTYDRTVKKRLYARAGIPLYWIVNLIDKQVEVHSAPSGPGDNPDFASRHVVSAAEDIEVIIDGKPVGQFAVRDLFP